MINKVAPVISVDEMKKAVWPSWLEDESLAIGYKAAKAQRDDTVKKIVEWGNEICTEHRIGNDYRRKRECKYCWQELERMVK